MDRRSTPIQSRIFDGLTEQERGKWLSSAVTRRLKRGETLARQGEPAQHFYVVDTGLLKLTQLTADGRETIVRFVGPAEPFGGVVALEGASYPVTALAAESTTVRAWAAPALAQLLLRFPRVRANVMREMAAHMTDAMTRVQELSTQRVPQRLAHTLLRLMRQCGQQTADGMLIPYALTRQELADLTGTTLYTVSRTLSEWNSSGIVRSRGRHLLVPSATRLEALAGSERT
jgi:CRP-like cAMP-binding protein